MSAYNGKPNSFWDDFVDAVERFLDGGPSASYPEPRRPQTPPPSSPRPQQPGNGSAGISKTPPKKPGGGHFRI